MPRLGAIEATVFQPGYGLIPCPEKAPWTSIGGASGRFPKVFFCVAHNEETWLGGKKNN